MRKYFRPLNGGRECGKVGPMLVLAYFRTPAEALHLALSRDGLDWAPLNQNRPVLEGTIGSRSLRDPFIVRGVDGLFHLLATNGWHAQSLVHATSPDLIHWSEQVLVPVMGSVPHTRNVWAPEAFWDFEAECYRLIWSSSVHEGDYPRGSDWDHRIWTASTTDFQEFSAPEIFFDPGHSVIDATVLPTNGEYWMVFKDERGLNDDSTPGKRLYIARSNNPMQFSQAWSEHPSAPLIPFRSEGPALIQRGEEFGHDFLLLLDRFLEGCYGAALSADGHEWHEAASSFPELTRHACLLEIPHEHAERLQAAFD